MSDKFDIKKIQDKLESGFYGFWVKKRRFTFLFMLILVFGGAFSVFTIPKESSPEIEFGIISITTIYQGVNPQDIDNLITEKIEKQIKNIDGVKKITSSSSIGISNTIVEFRNGVDMTQALVDIKDFVDKTILPSDAETPIVTNLTTQNELMFVMLLYGDEQKVSQEYLNEKAQKISSNLSNKGSISSINIGGSSRGSANVRIDGGGTSEFIIDISIDRNKLESLGLNLLQVAQSIRSRNKNQPLGNHIIGDLSYDFRIEGEINNISELYTIPIQTKGGFIYLGDISQIQQNLKDNSINRLGYHNNSGQNYIQLSFNKKPGTSIFDSAQEAKISIEEELKKIDYSGLQKVYTYDMSELIKDDYSRLTNNGIQTLILVFICLLIFVGLKESLIATVTIPLAFFVTFIVLKQLGLSLNFLTNFSFIITFGIAIDTTIVVIEGAHERMRQGYSAKNAILLAVRDYKMPLIAGTSTTVVVFLPLLTLPGLMGKFLAYIPITIFATLLAALFISLTINSALYYKLSGKKRKYYEDGIEQDYISLDDKMLLEHDRMGLEEKPHIEISLREKILDKISNFYEHRLEKIMKNKIKRILRIIIPFILLILSFVLLSPNIGFKLFPDSDNGYITATIKAKKGTTTDKMKTYYNDLDKVLSQIEEIKVYYYNIQNNSININIELLPLKYRKSKKLKNANDVEIILDNKLDMLRSYGLDIQVQALRNGPPGDKPIGIKLVADNNEKLDILNNVAKDFVDFLRNTNGTRNVSLSSEESPGQFVYTFKKDILSMLGLAPTDIYTELYAITNGLNVGSIKGEYNTINLNIKYSDYRDTISPTDINNININNIKGQLNIGSISDYEFRDSISTISRENTQIIVNINADLLDGFTTDIIQQDIDSFINKYNFPDGIMYKKGGENEENAELIQSVMVAFIISLLCIFGILVLIFNSYTQPIIIMSSVLMGFLGANIGLFITGNPYSMMFGIGFIALTGIVVNDAIIFIDRANRNMKKGMDRLKAITEAGHARLHPIILTTITTILGLTSIVTDPFWQGLAITVMFGILFGSSMTLFVIPAIYYGQKTLQKIIYWIFIIIGFILSGLIIVWLIWNFILKTLF